MSHIDSSSGSKHLVPNKYKWAVREFPLYCGRNAPRLNEEERCQFLTSRRACSDNEKPSQKQKNNWKPKEKDMAGSSNEAVNVTNVKNPKRKLLDSSVHRLVEKTDNQLSSGPSNLYPLGQNHKSPKYDLLSDESDRKRVIEAVSAFRDICSQLLKEKKKSDGEVKVRRVDCFAAKFLKEMGMYVHAGEKFIGCVPGVELGDRFIYRMELAVVGLHSPPVNGIDYTSYNGTSLATSVVASKSYADDLHNPDELIYIGEGGMAGKNKEPEDQKLVRGNRALMNSLRAKAPVRVVRQEEETRTRTFEYVYDGLYLVEGCEKVPWATGQLVFKFVLKRSSDQKYVRPCKVKF